MGISNKDIELAEREIVEEHQLKEKINNEEFKIWKKTVPLLYDTIHTYALDCPSLTVQWLPNYTISDNKNYVTVKFLFGTNTSQNSQDYLKLGSLSLPSTLAPDFSNFLPNSQSIPIPISNMDSDKSSFRILSTWKHNGEVNKLKISPNYEKVLTFDNQGIVHMFDLQNKESTEFKYHKQEGYALEWIDNQKFLSGAYDSQIALWDVSKPSTPIQLFKTHGSVINDLSYNSLAKNIFGSVSDDHSTQFHDIRAAGTNENPVIKVNNNHIQNAIEFHPDIETLYAIGGKDNIVSLYDMRNPSVPIRKFFGHNDSVIGIKWDKYHEPNRLMSWGSDKRFIIWDLNNLDEEFTYPTDANESSKKKTSVKADPCLNFIHGGHTNRINDVDAHPKIKDLYITVSDDNLLEIWKPKTIIAEENKEEENEEEDKEDAQENEKKEGIEANKVKDSKETTQEPKDEDAKMED